MTLGFRVQRRTRVAGGGGVGQEDVGVGGAGGAGALAQLAARAADVLGGEAARLGQHRQVADLGAVALRSIQGIGYGGLGSEELDGGGASFRSMRRGQCFAK